MKARAAHRLRLDFQIKGSDKLPPPMDDFRSQRLIHLKRQMALLRTDERRLVFIAASHYQTGEFKRQAETDLLRVRQKLEELARELNAVEYE